MKNFILDAMEFLMLFLLLGSSYLGFFFAGAVVLLTAGTELTKINILLVLGVSVSATHLLLRWLSNTLEAQRRRKNG